MSGTTANMNASLTLRLQDRLSAGLGALKQRLDSIRGAAERIGALGAIGAGLAIGAPIAAAARFDDLLRGIAITAGLSGAAAENYIAKLRRQFQLLALETGQTSEAVANAAGLMIQRGLPAELIDKLLPVTARVATAASSDMKDIAGVVESVNTALGVLPEQLDTAMAMLVVAAKEGKVELKDMAREFPALAAAAQNFGLRGLDGVRVLGSALQVAARASASPAEAANNMANLFQSLTRPETLKNFQKMGVDFPKVMKDAINKGINPLEAAIGKIYQVTRGDPFKLGALIGDLQAGRALLPFLRDAAKEYLRIRGVVGEATPEAIATDFETRMRGPAQSLAVAGEIMTQLTERFGRELFGRIAVVVAPLRMVRTLLDDIDQLAPDLVGRIVSFGAGMLALLSVLSAIVFVLPFFAAGWRVIAGLIRVVFGIVPLLVQGFTALGAVAGTIAAPIAAVLAVLALVGGIAYTIWANWSEFEGAFSAMWGGLRAVAQGFVGFLDGIFSGDMSRIIAGLWLMWEGFKAFFVALWDALSLVMDKWADGLSGWVERKVTAAIERIKQVWTDFKAWLTNLWSTTSFVPTGPDLSRWSDRPSSISNEPVGAALRRRLGLGDGATPAADLVRPAPISGSVDVRVTATEGTRAEIGGQAGPVNPYVRSLTDALRESRGQVQGRP